MKFPILNENEFAVLMANCQTGIVLDINLNTYLDGIENQDVYSIFEDIQKAKEFINRIAEQNDKIEFIIYNSKKEMIEFIKAKFNEHNY